MQGPGSRLYLLRRVHTIKIPFSMAHGHAVQMFFFWLAMTFIIFIYFPFAFSSHFHFNIAALFFLSSLFVLSFFLVIFVTSLRTTFRILNEISRRHIRNSVAGGVRSSGSRGEG